MIRSRCERCLKLSETGSETMDVALEKYFHRINKVEIKNKDGVDFTTGTVEITSVSQGVMRRL